MTTQPADNSPEIATDATEPATEGEHTEEPLADGPEHKRMGNREAAKYRTQLREAESQRDALQDRVARFERQQVDRIASAKLADPADFAPEDLDELRDDGGELDEQKVTAAVDELVEAKPHYRKPPPRSSSEMAGGAGSPSHPPRLGAIFSS